MERIIKRADVREKTTKKRNDKTINHAFRKRFETILKLNKDIPIAVSEKLIGHKVYFDDRGNTISLDDSYVVPEIEKLFEFFKLTISQLTIDDKERDTIKIKKLEIKKSQLEESKQENQLLKNRINDLEQESKNRNDELEKRIRMLEKSNL